VSEKVRINILRALVLVITIAAWQAIVQFDVMSDRVLASPTQIVSAIPTVLDHPDFWSSVRVTLWQTFVTFVLALAVGSILGILMSSYRAVRKAFVPYVVLLNSFPAVLLYPIFLIVFGLGTSSVVAVAIGLPIMVISLNTMEGLAGVPPVYESVGRSLRASPRQQFFKVRLPAARALIFTGWRVALLYTFISVVAIQFLLTGQGLGFLIIRYYDFFLVKELYASIVLVAVITIIIELALMLVEWLVVGERSSLRKTTRQVGIG
jgi:NitT/TauT family transport system permease protein